VQEYRYTYSLSPNSDDEQAWIFRYDYCREPELNVPHAHLHVNASDGGQQLKHIHFPTGRLSFEQVICHLVSECGVRVRNSDWKDCLVKSHSDFVGKLSAQELHQFP
jgi:hypothetical protein